MTAAENVRAYLNSSLLPSEAASGRSFEVDANDDGTRLTTGDLRALIIMAEAFEMEHPHQAAIIEHGACTKECFHLRA